MKESKVGIATCACRQCRIGDNKYYKKLRNRKRRKHINEEITYFLEYDNLDNFIMNSFSYYTD